MNISEIKKRFDGTHHKGRSTFVGVGASPTHQLISVFLEVADGTDITRVECQMTATQAEYLAESLAGGINDLSRNLN